MLYMQYMHNTNVYIMSDIRNQMRAHHGDKEWLGWSRRVPEGKSTRDGRLGSSKDKNTDFLVSQSQFTCFDPQCCWPHGMSGKLLLTTQGPQAEQYTAPNSSSLCSISLVAECHIVLSWLYTQRQHNMGGRECKKIKKPQCTQSTLLRSLKGDGKWGQWTRACLPIYTNMCLWEQARLKGFDNIQGWDG